MNRFRFLAFAAFVGWCSAIVALSAQGGGAAPARRSAGARQGALCRQVRHVPPGKPEGHDRNAAVDRRHVLVELGDLQREQPRRAGAVDDAGGQPRRAEREQYVDIIAYILKTNEVPFTGDLPGDADALKKITIKKKE